MSETLATAMLLRRFFTQEKSNISEWVKGWFEDVNGILESIALGSSSLVCSGTGRLESDQLTLAPFSTTQDFKPSFDMRNMIFQRLDPDHLDAEDDRDGFDRFNSDLCF